LGEAAGRPLGRSTQPPPPPQLVSPLPLRAACVRPPRGKL